MTLDDIANKALARLGAHRITSLDDGSTYANILNDVVDDVIEEIIRIHKWPRLKKTAGLEETSDLAWESESTYSLYQHCTNDSGKLYVCTTSGISAESGGPTGTDTGITDGTVTWAYRGNVPDNATDYIYQYVEPYNCLRILNLVDNYEYLLEDDFYIYSDAEDAKIKYLKKQVNPNMWDPLMRTCVILRIAWITAYDITNKKEKRTEMRDEFLQMISTADGIARQEGQNRPSSEEWWGDPVGARPT